MTTPTGTLRLPVTPATSTVLGNRVTADSISWRGLDWSDVRIDHGLPFLPEPGAVLNPAYAHPAEKGHPGWYGVRYRVRCRHEIGQRINVSGRYAYVVSVEAEQSGKGWEWVVGYGARPAGG
ncbi:MAG TPA: hypothetical protein VNH18_08110 [Bryobacteraceae bacterium]|nr:hypothetical protein [Bryobacteraceae bacterium]